MTSKPAEETVEKTKNEIHREYCPNNCGWFREYNTMRSWKGMHITHPVYGDISEVRLVNKDVAGHVCEEYLAAKERLNRSNQK